MAHKTVWVLQSGYTDQDGYEQFDLDTVFASFPTRKYLEEKLKGYSVHPDFISNLINNKRADHRDWGGYDPWTYELKEVELTECT